MGAQREGVYRESGTVERIDGELPIKWRVPAGGGYAGPAVADGKVFVFDYVRKSGTPTNDPGGRVNLQGSERVRALDAATGKEIWSHQYDCPYNISYPAGPRCTPTIDGDRVYTLGSEGDLRCLNVADGKPLWTVNFKTDFTAEVPIWGFSSHPLVAGDLVYAMVGGPGQGLVAWDKMSGEVRFKTLDARAGYCPPSMIRRGDRSVLVAFHPEGVVGLEPANGAVLWSVPLKPQYDMSITRPMVNGNRMYVSGIRTEALMIELSSDGTSAKEVWYGDPKAAVHCANSTPIFTDDAIYGTDCNIGNLVAVDPDDGSQLWTSFDATRPGETRRLGHGTAFLTRVAGTDRYWIMSETGELIHATLTPEGYTELGRQKILEPTGECFGRDVVWSHPAYAGRTVYARNDKEIVAVDIASNQ